MTSGGELMMDNEKLADVLNHLIEVCKDGEKGYREAADEINDGYYQILFKEYARQRAQFASELQIEVKKLGCEPERTGSLTGALHREWIHLRSVKREHDTSVVLECQRGDDIAMLRYKHALEKDLPASIESLLRQQLEKITETRSRVHAMEMDRRAQKILKTN
jgi:uncharacterized protein (TIGR02284 family)